MAMREPMRDAALHRLWDKDMNLVAAFRCSCPKREIDPRCPTHGTSSNPGSCRFIYQGGK